MSERLPYEEKLKQQLEDLPLPDQEQSWQKMELLLDDDKKRRIIPPIFLNGCLGWGLLLIGLMVIGWFMFRPLKEDKKTAKAPTEQTKSRAVPSDENNHETPGNKINQGATNAPSTLSPSKPNGGRDSIDATSKQDRASTQTGKETGGGQNNESTRTAKSATASTTTAHKTGRSTKTGASPRMSKAGAVIPVTVTRNNAKKGGRDQFKDNKNTVPSKNKKTSDTGTSPAAPEVQTKKNPLPSDTIIKKDSVRVIKKDSVKAPVDTAVVKNNKPVIPSKRKYYFSAGIGLQQLIPLSGQKNSSYNAYGRKGALADYIPSVYLRFHRQEKWFAMVEFRYGAPQTVKEVSYSQKSVTIFDTSGTQVISTTTTATSTLKKTYYHELPLGVNYMVRKNWSVGTGILYTRFYSAVSEENVKVHNNITQTESTSTKIVQVPASTDSFFTKSQVHLLLQSEYQWKRFAFGLRYTRGLQPFLIYTTPAGERKEERNQSLNVYARFRLWKQKTK